MRPALTKRRGSGYLPALLFGGATLATLSAMVDREYADWARQKAHQAAERGALAAAAALQADDYFVQSTTPPGPALPDFLTARRAAVFAVYGDPTDTDGRTVPVLSANLANDALGDIVLGELRVGPGGLRHALFAEAQASVPPPNAARVNVRRLGGRPQRTATYSVAAAHRTPVLRLPVAGSWAATAALTPATAVGEGRLGPDTGLPGGVFPLCVDIDTFAALAADPLTSVSLGEAADNVLWTDLGDPGRDAAAIVRFLGARELPGTRPPLVRVGTAPQTLADPQPAWDELAVFCGPSGSSQGRVAVCPVLISSPPLHGVIGFARLLLHDADPVARTVLARVAPSAAVQNVSVLGELRSVEDFSSHPQLQHLYGPGCVSRPWGVASAARLVRGDE